MTEKGNRPEEKNDRVVLTELLNEFIGFLDIRKGIFTFKQLWKEPGKVLSSYLNNESVYLSPFRMLALTLSLFAFLFGYLLESDWQELREAYILMRKKTYYNSPDEDLLTFMKGIVISGDILTYLHFRFFMCFRFLIFYSLSSILVFSYVVSKGKMQHGVDFKSALAANSYLHSSAGIPVLFAFAVLSKFESILPYIFLIAIYFILHTSFRKFRERPGISFVRFFSNRESLTSSIWLKKAQFWELRLISFMIIIIGILVRGKIIE
jgi:hypothetical protein